MSKVIPDSFISSHYGVIGTRTLLKQSSSLRYVTRLSAGMSVMRTKITLRSTAAPLLSQLTASKDSRHYINSQHTALQANTSSKCNLHQSQLDRTSRRPELLHSHRSVAEMTAISIHMANILLHCLTNNRNVRYSVSDFRRS